MQILRHILRCPDKYRYAYPVLPTAAPFCISLQYSQPVRVRSSTHNRPGEAMIILHSSHACRHGPCPMRAHEIAHLPSSVVGILAVMLQTKLVTQTEACHTGCTTAKPLSVSCA